MKPSDFWNNLEADNMDTKDIAPLLYFLAKLMNAKTTLEIGVYQGYISIGLAYVAKENEGKHYMIERRKDFASKTIELIKKHNLLNSAYMINGESEKVSWDKEIDLLFIDSDHSERAVIDAIEKFGKFVRKDGFMCLHDYCHKKGEVNLAADKHIKDGWEKLLIPYSSGLLVCRKNG